MIDACLSIAALLVLAPAAEPADPAEGVVPRPAQTPTKAEPGSDRNRPYVLASLGGGSAWNRRSDFVVNGPALAFGIEAGARLRDRGHRRISIGGAFLQSGWGGVGPGWPSRSSTDLLARVRVGGFGRRVWGYGIGGLGMAIETEDGGDYFAVDGGPTAQLGAGVGFDFTNRTNLSLEADATAAFLLPDAARVRISAGLVFSWRFGDR